MEDRKIAVKEHLPFMLIFPAVLLYFEIIFHIATVGWRIDSSLFYVTLFSISFGAIGYLLTSIFKNEKANYIITIVIMSLTALVFLIFYFVYKQFKIVYDLNTVFGGAGGVLGDFASEMFKLIFNFDGIFKIALYCLPIVLFAIFGRKEKFFRPRRANKFYRMAAAGVIALFYLLGVLFVSLGSSSALYDKEYEFNSATGRFGLMTGLRLDAQNMLFGSSQGGFETEPTDTPVGDDKPDEPIVYKDNVMDLDFTKPCSSAIKNLNDYVSTLTPSKQNEYTGLFKGKNLIMISAEAFSAEVIDPVLTPTLYRLANKGINFTDYYQPASAGTTGGEYQNVFGMLPMAGGKSFKNTANHLNYLTMGSQLDRLGYYGRAFHNNSYTYYQRNETHINLGYSHGFMGYGNGMEQYVKNLWPQSDLEMFEGTLPTYIDSAPFNVYYMSVSGHSGYSRVGNSMTAKNWDRVAHLDYSERVKGYLAANLEFEDAMAYLVKTLEEKGIADDTVICISTDHFPYGLDTNGTLGNMPYLSELYGYNVTNIFQRDHSDLILWCGCLEDEDPIVVDEPTSSLDILPTLSNLFGTEFDSRLMPGRDVFSDAEALVFNTGYGWKTSLGTYNAGKFTPVSEDTVIPEGYVENMKTVVRNKIRFCSGVLETDYYRYLFG
ncbi:MAG: sulfatase-like hydrolase/transferase [Clostridia bacterium]|nr:sulfatase-like hydrolase/transferase [Clostridia bacterium]